MPYTRDETAIGRLHYSKRLYQQVTRYSISGVTWTMWPCFSMAERATKTVVHRGVAQTARKGGRHSRERVETTSGNQVACKGKYQIIGKRNHDDAKHQETKGSSVTVLCAPLS